MLQTIPDGNIIVVQIKGYNFIGMSGRHNRPHFDKAERFGHCYSLPHQERRHFWGKPNTNFGFYTSEQLEELRKRAQLIKDQSSPSAKVIRKPEGTFIVSGSEKGYVHCCTCHNNPRRYILSEQRCKFCLSQQGMAQQTSSTRNQLISSLSNNPEANDYKTVKTLKTVDDKSIQVELKLPSIFKHNQKQPKNCRACKEKKALLQVSKVKRRCFTQEIEDESGQKDIGQDSLLYSFSPKKCRPFRI